MSMNSEKWEGTIQFVILFHRVAENPDAVRPAGGSLHANREHEGELVTGT